MNNIEKEELAIKLREEYKELSNKIKKLVTTLNDPEFKDKVTTSQYVLLWLQHNAMRQYKEVLERRFKDLKIKFEKEND